jgi:hypothetical protein
MPTDRYQVSWLPDARESLKELAKKAREVGLLDAIKQALTELNQRLEHDPLEVGELTRGKGRIVHHVASHKLVGIDFGIDTEKKVVAVRRCWALPKRGL